MPASTTSSLAERDWAEVEHEYEASSPYNFSILDSFFTDEALTRIRTQLLTNWGWQYKNWQAEELYVRDPEISEISVTARELKQCLPNVLDGLEYVRCWAFMHQRNAGLKVHADNGAVTVDVWLTPDSYNMEPESGGIVFYDLKRDPGMMIHEFNTVEWAEKYFHENWEGQKETVGYGYNRAVLFDAATFHESDRVNFRTDSAETYRINLSLLFDDPIAFANRREMYD